jgi:pyruvate dehydrogenase E1 component alpha subunit
MSGGQQNLENKETTPMTSKHARELLRQMVFIRRFEEKCAELYGAEKIRGFLHLYIGEEANAVGVMQALTPDDAVVATYREHGHASARGLPAREIMAEMYGKASGSSGGRGGSMHIFSAKHRFFGGNAIVGGGFPMAAGLALADKMRKLNRVTCCFFGDGATAEGEFHESLNLAALWKLPVLFVCENNLYAMGTHIDRAQSEPDMCVHARSYRIPAETVDGMDVLAVEAAARRGAAAIRRGDGPYFLENRTYRFRAHSMFDPELYRGKAEVEEWKKRDPIPRFANWALEYGVLERAEIDSVNEEAARELDEAVAYAEAAPWEPVEGLLRDVYTPCEAAS